MILTVTLNCIYCFSSSKEFLAVPTIKSHGANEIQAFTINFSCGDNIATLVNARVLQEVVTVCLSSTSQVVTDDTECTSCGS